MLLVASVLLFVLAAIAVLVAKLRSRALIRQIKVLARGSESANRAGIQRGGGK